MNEREFLPVNIAAALRERVDFNALKTLADHWVYLRKEDLVAEQDELSTASLRGEIKILKNFQKLAQTVETKLSEVKNKS